MLSRAQLDDYVSRKGPYLYHRAPAEALPLIARQGLLPWDGEEREDVPADWDEGSTTIYADSRMTPRSDHVYIGGPGYVRRYDGLTLRIDLRELDPLLLDSDEDHFDLTRYQLPAWATAKLEAVAPPPREWGSWADYVDPDCPDCNGAGGDCLGCEGSGKDIYADPRDEGTLGDWADSHADILDAPDFVAYSLDCGSLAIKGSLPPQAISLDPAQLARRDLESLARAFDGIEAHVPPFTVEHEGQKLMVAPDPLGRFELPDDVPRWRVEGYVQEARGKHLVELLNGGQLRIHPRPALDDAASLAQPSASAGELDLARV